MLERILEPEVMDTESEAVDYDAMDHSSVNRVFVDDLLGAIDRQAITPAAGTALTLLDVGTGTAQIPIELCSRGRDVRITAVDLAAHMLQIGQRNVIRAGCHEWIRLDQIDAKSLPYANGTFDCVMSNSIVHHIPHPLDVWREMQRVLKPGGLLFVRDLLRPDDLATLTHLVDTYADDANGHQRQMFGDSLHAALTVREVQDILRALNLPTTCCRQTTDRHWTVEGMKAEGRRMKDEGGRIRAE